MDALSHLAAVSGDVFKRCRIDRVVSVGDRDRHIIAWLVPGRGDRHAFVEELLGGDLAWLDGQFALDISIFATGVGRSWVFACGSAFRRIIRWLLVACIGTVGLALICRCFVGISGIVCLGIIGRSLSLGVVVGVLSVVSAPGIRTVGLVATFGGVPTISLALRVIALGISVGIIVRHRSECRIVGRILGGFIARFVRGIVCRGRCRRLFGRLLRRDLAVVDGFEHRVLVLGSHRQVVLASDPGVMSGVLALIGVVVVDEVRHELIGIARLIIGWGPCARTLVALGPVGRSIDGDQILGVVGQLHTLILAELVSTEHPSGLEREDVLDLDSVGGVGAALELELGSRVGILDGPGHHLALVIVFVLDIVEIPVEDVVAGVAAEIIVGGVAGRLGRPVPELVDAIVVFVPVGVALGNVEAIDDLRRGIRIDLAELSGPTILDTHVLVERQPLGGVCLRR